MTYRKFVSYIFSLLITLFPVLSIYQTPVERLSYADFFLVTTILMMLLAYLPRFEIKINSALLMCFFYLITISTFYYLQVYYEHGVEFNSTFRYIIFLLAIVLGYRFFIKDFAIKALGYVTLFVSLLVICQFLSFYFFQIIIPWKIPLIPVIDNSFVEAVNEHYFLTFYRPTGVFYEPTHFAQYAFVYFIYMLSEEYRDPSKSFIKEKSVVFLAIIMSASSLGFISLFFIFSYKFFFLRRERLGIKFFLMVPIFLLVLSYVFYSVEYFSFIIKRVYDIENNALGPAVGYRFNSISLLFSNTDIYSFMIGNGRGSEKAYFTGVFYIFNSVGLIGLLLYCSLMLSTYLNSDGFGKMLIFVAFLVSFGSEFIANFGIMFYILFSLKKYKEI